MMDRYNVQTLAALSPPLHPPRSPLHSPPSCHDGRATCHVPKKNNLKTHINKAKKIGCIYTKYRTILTKERATMVKTKGAVDTKKRKKRRVLTAEEKF